MKQRKKSIITIYGIILAVIVSFSLVSFIQVFYLSSLFSFKHFSINISSGVCNTGPGYAIVIASYSSCKSCKVAYNSFINVTSKYGIWSNNQFYSPMGMCAYVINLSNINSSVFPAKLYSIYLNYSDDYVPFFYFNGVYYKIGGFETQNTANYMIEKYICKSSLLCLNNSKA